MSDLSMNSSSASIPINPENILNDLPCPVFSTDTSLGIHYINKKAQELGLNQKDFITQKFGNVVSEILKTGGNKTIDLEIKGCAYAFHVTYKAESDTIEMVGTDLDTIQKKLDASNSEKAFYEVILNNIPADIAVFSPDYKFLYVNPTGVKDEVLRKWLIGKTEFDYCSYRNRPTTQAEHRQSIFNKVIKKKDSPEWVEDFSTKGKNKHILRKFHAVYNANNEISYVLGYGIDITNRVEVDEKFLELAKYTEENPNAVVRIDMDGLMTFGNIVGKKFYNLWLKQHEDKPEAIIRELEGENDLNTDFSFRKTIHTQTYTVKVIPDTGKNCLILYATDISRQIEARKIIVRKDRLLEGVASASKELLIGKNLNESINKSLEILGKKTAVDRVYIFENHTDDDGNLLLSQRFEWTRDGIEAQIDNPDLQGLSYEFIPGVYQVLTERKKFSSLVKHLEGNAKEILQSQRIHSILLIPIFIKEYFWGFIGFDDCHEERSWSKNDEALLTTMGASIGEALVKNSIETEREILLQKLKHQTLELKNSNAELEQFAYVASHDLKQPLRTITSFAQLIELNYKDKLDEKASRYIDLIVNATGRMHNLINDLLNYSRVSRQVTNFQFTDLNKVVKNVINNLDASINENGAEILVGTLPTLYSDEQQLTQVFQNLIDNAIKFQSQNKPIIHIEYELRENDYLFLLKDNGIGLNMDYQEKIFQVFQQLDNNSKSKGTGVGLAICKKIIEQHKGKIWIDSKPGDGCSFYFTISKNLLGTKPIEETQAV